MTAEPMILLVEDNRDEEELTVQALRKMAPAHKIMVARDGAEALDVLFNLGRFAGRGAHVEPRIILLDLQLPKVRGADVLRKIRSDARTKLLPVVVLTSSVEDRDLTECYALGANSYVRKPVDFNAFLELAAHLSRYWLDINQPPPHTHLG